MDAVIVRLHDEHYAIDVADVVEVCERGALTPVWGASPLVAGVRNLRGVILPVLDLAAALGLPSQADAPYVVVVASGPIVAALGVDAVMEVASLAPGRRAGDRPGLSGRAPAGDGLVGVIDVGAILAMAAPA